MVLSAMNFVAQCESFIERQWQVDSHIYVLMIL